MRSRHPFPDLPLEFDAVVSIGDGSEDEPSPELVMAASKPAPHPDAVEKGTEIPLAHWHKGENRTQRRAAVANWVPPKIETAGVAGNESAPDGPRPEENAPSTATPPGRMPTRRELLKQRQKHRRGKLDIELRRLQRRKAKR